MVMIKQQTSKNLHETTRLELLLGFAPMNLSLGSISVLAKHSSIPVPCEKVLLSGLRGKILASIIMLETLQADDMKMRVSQKQKTKEVYEASNAVK